MSRQRALGQAMSRGAKAPPTLRKAMASGTACPTIGRVRSTILFRPVVTEHYRAGTFPMELVPEMAQLGVFGPSIKGYGCAGLGSIAAGLMMQELERGDSGLRTFASVQGSLAMMAINLFGSEEQKNRWLPEMAQGKKLGC